MKLYLTDRNVGALSSQWTEAEWPKPVNFNLTGSTVGIPAYALSASPTVYNENISWKAASLGGASYAWTAPQGSKNHAAHPWMVATVPLTGSAGGFTIPATMVFPTYNWGVLSTCKVNNSANLGGAGNWVVIAAIYTLNPSTGVRKRIVTPKATRWWTYMDANGGFGHANAPYGTASMPNIGSLWWDWISAANRNTWLDIQDATGVLPGDYLCYEIWAGHTHMGVNFYGNQDVVQQMRQGTYAGHADQSSGPNAYTNASETGTTFFYWDDLHAPSGVDVGLPSTPTAVNLISVDPLAGPKVRLGFDNPVGIDGPTIGAATAGLGVTGATQVDDTHIDLDTDYPPTHPLGEAEEDKPPSPPKGGGAFQL